VRTWLNSRRADLPLDDLIAVLRANLDQLDLSDSMEEIDRMHADIVASYRDRMLPPSEPGRLFVPHDKPAPFVNTRCWQDRTARAELEGLYHRFRHDQAAS
jgi:hypothetical protein